MNRRFSTKLSIPKPIRFIAALLAAFYLIPADTNALEVYATSTTTYNVGVLDTANPLVMDESSTKEVYFWLSYSPAERTSINTDGGLFGGGFQIPFVNTSIANIVNASDIAEATTEGGINWGTFTPNNPPPSAAFFTLGSFALPDQPAILFAKATITSGNLGTTLANLSADPVNDWYTNGITLLTPTYMPFNVTVVPEPSAYALACVGVMVLGYAGRRKRLARSPLCAESAP